MPGPIDAAARPGAAAETAWHALAAAEALSALDAGEAGLGEAEAAARRARVGENRLPEPPQPGMLRRFLRQFDNVLMQVLIGAAIVTALLGHVADTAVIVAVVLINALVGFLQEGKAEQALAAVRRMLSPRASVLRGGHRIGIAAEGLVPGDIVLLEPGDRVPADLRILSARGLAVQEAVLTGESMASPKAPAPVPVDAALGDRASMAYSGTVVAAGHGRGVVVATGAATELGRISALLAGVETMETPLLRAMARFGRLLTAVILALAALTFAVGTGVHGWPAGETFMAAVGLAVAAIPEGLPAVITIALAIGVRRMAQSRAIIRRLPAVEALGSVTIVCTDKTGTLTRNELVVREVLLGPATVRFTGDGYDPTGEALSGDRAVTVEEDDGLAALLEAALLCSDAALVREGESWAIAGDPVDGAILVAAAKAGADAAAIARTWPRTDAIPFESEHRFMASLVHDHAGRGRLVVKGAPEAVLPRCTGHGEGWPPLVEAAAARGLRLIAIAAADRPAEQRVLRFEDVTGLTLLGLVALIDAPRAEAIEAVALCRGAGIAVAMITGDHAGTALAIAREVGIDTAAGALTGADLEAMDDATLADAVGRVRVFARVAPAHKLRLVSALQAAGEVVAMTGDGVNDAPALKRADIGVAMGRSGSEAAKEAAEIVLADDNFATIAAAVREGRAVYDNLTKTILMMLPTSAGEALVVMAAVLLGTAMPVTAVQILWVNLITAVLLNLALVFERPERDVMTRPPRDPTAPILSPFLVRRTVFVSVLMGVATFAVFQLELARGSSLEAARGAAVTALVMMEAAYLLNTRHLVTSCMTVEGVTGSPIVLGAIALVMALQVLFVVLPPAQAVFGVAAPDALAWGIITAVAVGLFLIVEAEKALLRR